MILGSNPTSAIVFNFSFFRCCVLSTSRTFGNKLLFLKPMLTVTNHTLEKLEMLLKTTGYKVRYEKGNFKTGACLLQNSKVIVVNKFSGLESKILAISELARDLEMDYNLLDDKQIAFHQQLKQIKLEL
jgi:hypothetical protein